MPGIMYRSMGGGPGFEIGPTLFPPTMRHSAVSVQDDVLWVFWRNVGDAPEHMLVSSIALTPDWQAWQVSQTFSLAPYEGADEPVSPSLRSVAYGRQCQGRDPAIFEEGGQIYLLYALARASGIGLGQLFFDQNSQDPVDTTYRLHRSSN